MVTFEEIGRKVARLGMRVLAGEDAQAAARSESHQAAPMFDWRELRRWSISETRLPPDSVVRFREATYWERHHRFIIGAITSCSLQAFLIGALLIQRRRRRWPRFLRESERRMSLAADAANLGIWIRHFVGDEIWATEKWRELFGFEKSERLDMQDFLQRVHRLIKNQSVSFSPKRSWIRRAMRRNIESCFPTAVFAGLLPAAGPSSTPSADRSSCAVSRWISPSVNSPRRHRRKAEIRFRTMANTAPVMTECRTPTRYAHLQ